MSVDHQDRPGRAVRGLEHLLKVRYLAVVVVLVAVLHAVAFLVMGVRIAVKTYVHIAHGAVVGSPEAPGLELLHSLDSLLVGLVLIILATGVAKLFLVPSDEATTRSLALPSWLDIKTFTDLKVLLWETILLALMIIGLSTLTVSVQGQLQWTALIIPCAILLLALSLYFMKRV